MMKSIFLAFFVALVASYPTNSPAARHGKLRVQGNQLVSASGGAVQLRGMSTHGPQWFEQCYTRESFQALAHDWKADVVRIAMYVNEHGYNEKPDYWKGRVAEMVNWAGELGLYALIDWHTLTPGNPNDGSYSLHNDFWNFMSSKFASKDHVLYEICNEPNGVNWSQVENYAKPLIELIRRNDPSTIIVVGTSTWSQDLWAVTPLHYSNIMYTLHFYASSHFFQDMVQEQAGRLPIFVTEYGTCEASGGGALNRDNFEKWVSVLNGNNKGGQKISFINWSFSQASEGCAALKQGACDSKQWSSLTESGRWIKEKIQEAH